MSGITTQQQHVLNYLRVFVSLNDALPSTQQIAREFGYASPNAAGEILIKLAKHGLIEKNEAGGYRFSRAPTTASKVKAALERAARYLAAKNDDDASIGSEEADAIAATLQTLAARIPQS